ncbi:MAG: 5'-methylthioadenosine/S-adenosylhomocysteine nucleosidase [Clostridiales bacterium]|nr:5'-methylthioadenosine/S-adenosylhomocysteine nucleosidase [Clostridiales bacterium]
MKIGIFTAMEKEATSFLQADAVKEVVGMFTFYHLALGKHSAVLCCPPSVGEIAASAACQLLITKYGVDCILNFGVVGALTPKASVQSFVYVKDVVHYDMDISVTDNIPIGRYRCFDDVAVKCDESLLYKAMQVNRLPAVRCASADKFVDTVERKTALHKNFGADICDMESAGILFACRFNNVPCLLVKCISDSLTDGAQEYRNNVYSACKGFFLFAEQLANNL